jgi:hypothetical protein
MVVRLCSPSTPLSQDHSLQVLGMGDWGARVVELVRQESDRLQVASKRLALHLWNPVQPGGGNNLFQPFDAAASLQDARHVTLRRQLSHVMAEEIVEDIQNDWQLPASGYLALHDNVLRDLLQRLKASLDVLRQANPEKPLRLIVVGNLGEGCVAGALTPLLFHLQPHLQLRRVDLHVWVSTGEGTAANAEAQRRSDLNCGAALQQLQRVVLGQDDVLLPGQQGLREDHVLQGPVVPLIQVFSGGIDTARHAPGVLASIVANNLLCLETTFLDERLQAERDLHGEEILERSWSNSRREHVPTRCATFQVGGIKADCLPAVFHLRAVRHVVDSVTRSLARSAQDKARAAALRCVEEARLGATEIIHDLELDRTPLTRKEIRDENVPKPQLHDFIKTRLDQDLGQLLNLATQKTPPPPYRRLVELAQQHCNMVAQRLANSEAAFLPAAIEFYRTLEKELVRLRGAAEDKGQWAQRELGRSPSRDRLDRLLVRLADDLTDHGDDLHGRFAETMTVALPIQIRKILEVAAEIRGHALVIGASPVLQSFYTELLQECERRREALQKLVYELNQVAASCVRREEHMLRSARSAFTYQKGRFEAFVDAAWERARRIAGGMRVSPVLQRLGEDIAILASMPDLETRLVDVVRPEVDRLVAHGDEIMATEPLARRVLQDAILALHPTVDVQRTDLGEFKTLRPRFVVCSRRFLHAHADLLEDYLHIEATAPWNVWISEHEEGLPFEAMQHAGACVQSLHRDTDHKRARRACATADAADALPAADEDRA